MKLKDNILTYQEMRIPLHFYQILRSMEVHVVQVIYLEPCPHSNGIPISNSLIFTLIASSMPNCLGRA